MQAKHIRQAIKYQICELYLIEGVPGRRSSCIRGVLESSHKVAWLATLFAGGEGIIKEEGDHKVATKPTTLLSSHLGELQGFHFQLTSTFPNGEGSYLGLPP